VLGLSVNRLRRLWLDGSHQGLVHHRLDWLEVPELYLLFKDGLFGLHGLHLLWLLLSFLLLHLAGSYEELSVVFLLPLTTLGLGRGAVEQSLGRLHGLLV